MKVRASSVLILIAIVSFVIAVGASHCSASETDLSDAIALVAGFAVLPLTALGSAVLSCIQIAQRRSLQSFVELALSLGCLLVFCTLVRPI
jgi:uncharacterized membrane protein